MNLKPIVAHLRRNRARMMGKTVLRCLHIRKTGGTAMREAIGQRRETPSHLILFERHATRLSDLRPGEAAAFVWRDPVSRYVSGFHSRQREGRPRYHNPWSAEEAEVFARFDSPDALGRALAEDRPEARFAMENVRHLKAGYGYWFDSPDALRARAETVAFVGRQDHLRADFEVFRALTRLPGEVALPDDPVKAHRSTAPVQPLSETAREALRDWYATDYAFVEVFEEIRRARHPAQNP